jgi:hypothetical protein
MPLPIICAYERVQQYLMSYRDCLSKPQYKYFVIVLLGFIQCQGARTLSGLRHCVAEAGSLSGLSRFLARAPWDVEALAKLWQARFRVQMRPVVQAELTRLKFEHPKRRGRPRQPVVTGYLIGDDSTMQKAKGRTMEGIGKHHSTTHEHRVRGHSLVQGLYVLLGRRCPTAARLYRQQAVCAREQVPFQSKIDLMIEMIQRFEPTMGTLTHVLLDSWYSAKAIWKAARDRHFLITTGIKSNRSLRVADPSQPNGWKLQHLNDYAARLCPEDYVQLPWPRGEESDPVYVHVVSTRVRKLYCCQVIIVRRSLQEPLKLARYWASSDLEASVERLVEHISARWDIEILFADGKEELGLDQYQLMSAKALVRFWSLAMLAYAFLDEERVQLRASQQRPVTIGQTRRELQRLHRRQFLLWLQQSFQAGSTAESLFELLSA